MNFSQYQAAAREFRALSANPTYVALGLGAEVGEVLDKLAKHIRDGRDLEETRGGIQKEIGDVLWFLASMCDDLGIELDAAAWGNIEKLRDRKARNVIHGSGDNR